MATTLDRVTLHIVDEAGRIVPKPLSGDIKVSWDPRNAIPAEPTMPLSWKLPEEICALAPVFTIDFYQKVGKRRTSRHIRVGVQVCVGGVGVCVRVCGAVGAVVLGCGCGGVCAVPYVL